MWVVAGKQVGLADQQPRQGLTTKLLTFKGQVGNLTTQTGVDNQIVDLLRPSWQPGNPDRGQQPGNPSTTKLLTDNPNSALI